jgi:phospholipid-binding lipoprotein MlaA
VAALCSGCATVAENADPLEKVNRPIYNFNQKFDQVLLKPLADAYVKVTPQPVQTMVSHFYDNAAYPEVILNDFLQGKAEQGWSDIGRFIFNTVFGIAGLFDPATAVGMRQHDEDFGQTLGVWGAGQGAYLVLPVIGPNTVRDSPGIPFAIVTNLLFYISKGPAAWPLTILGGIDARARARAAFQFINMAALDPYAFTREAYLQHRDYLIYGSRPQRLELPDDSLEEPTAPK